MTKLPVVVLVPADDYDKMAQVIRAIGLGNVTYLVGDTAVLIPQSEDVSALWRQAFELLQIVGRDNGASHDR